MTNVNPPHETAARKEEATEKGSEEELHKLVKARLHASAQSRKKACKDKKSIKVTVGDLVLVKAHPISEFWANVTKKLFLLYKGPFKVQEVLKETCYVLKDIDTEEIIGRFNASQLKVYHQGV